MSGKPKSVCPVCNGKGGSFCHDGEWSECYLCNESGKVTRKQIAKHEEEMKRLDEWCEQHAIKNGWTQQDKTAK